LANLAIVNEEEFENYLSGTYNNHVNNIDVSYLHILNLDEDESQEEFSEQLLTKKFISDSSRCYFLCDDDSMIFSCCRNALCDKVYSKLQYTVIYYCILLYTDCETVGNRFKSETEPDFSGFKLRNFDFSRRAFCRRHF